MRGYVARDKDDEVYLYTHKPYKSKLLGYWFLDYGKYPNGKRMLIDKLYILTDINPQWEDTEPIEVNVNITKASDDMVTIPKGYYEHLLECEKQQAIRQAIIELAEQVK